MLPDPHPLPNAPAATAEGTTADWDESAGAWTVWESQILSFLAPITAAMQFDLALQPGERLLDVGCGTGEPVLTLAPLTSPAPAYAFDASAGMLEAAIARSRAAHARPGLRWLCASGEAPPFRAGSFDAISARLSVMLFDDVAAGLARTRALLRPGGRMSVAVWAAAEVNPVFGIPVCALQEAGEPQRHEPDRPGPLRLSRPNQLEAALADAGFADFRIREVECRQTAPSIGSYFTMLQQVSVHFRKRYRALDAARQAAVKARLETELQAYSGPGGVSVPARARVALAWR